jgi:hypothetical protein
MPARNSRRSKQKFVLGLRAIRLALAKSESNAGKAVTAGKKAVASAKNTKNYKALKANQTSLADAMKAQKNLAAAVKLIAGACCEQSFGCDLKFD